MESRRLFGCRLTPAKQAVCGLIPIQVVAGVVGVWDIVTSALNGLILLYLLNEELKLKHTVRSLEVTRVWVYASFASIPLSVLGLVALGMRWQKGMNCWSAGKQVYTLLYTCLCLYNCTTYCRPDDQKCVLTSITGVLIHRLCIDLYTCYLIWSACETLNQESNPHTHPQQVEMSDRPLIRSN